MNLVEWSARTAASLPLVREVMPWLGSKRVAVVGDSMYPLLRPGDVLLCDRLAYVGRDVARGDIVVFQHGSSQSGRMIKLVAGMPGEHIEVRGDRLWIDGCEIDFHSPMVGSLPGRWQVGADELFVLSYAVAVGTDSRAFGPIRQSQVLGRGWYVLAPQSRAGRLEALDLRAAGSKTMP